MTIGRPAHVHHPGTEFISSPRQRELVLEAVRKGQRPGTVMRALGLGDTIAGWRIAVRDGFWKTGKPVLPESLTMMRDFMEKLEQAQAEAEQRLVQVIEDAAGRVNEKTGLVDWQPAKFLLTHGAHRAEWFPHQEQTTVNVNMREVGPEFREAREMTDTELLGELPEEWQALLGEAPT